MDNKLAVTTLFSNYDTPRYPQPLVAEAIEAEQRDMNLWRLRGYLDAKNWEKNGRVTYTGRGLLAAGVISEFAFIVGPSFVVDNYPGIFGAIDDIAAGRYSDEMWPGLCFRLTRAYPDGSYSDEEGGDEVSGFPPPEFTEGKTPSMMTFDRLSEDRKVKCNGTFFVLPIGFFIERWAKRAEKFLADRQSGG